MSNTKEQDIEYTISLSEDLIETIEEIYKVSKQNEELLKQLLKLKQTEEEEETSLEKD